MATGRPTLYTPELASRICELVATTPGGIKKLCAAHDWMPDVTTIYLWKFKHESFSQQYRDAKQAQMDIVMEQMDDLLTDSLGYYYDAQGNKRIDPPSVTLGVAKSNNQKWFASKIAPKLYGDKMQNEVINTDQDKDEAIKKLRTELDNKNKKDY